MHHWDIRTARNDIVAVEDGNHFIRFQIRTTVAYLTVEEAEAVNAAMMKATARLRTKLKVEK